MTQELISSTNKAFAQELDDINIFTAPLAELAQLAERAPDERAKGFIDGILAFRTQLSILTDQNY